MMSELEQFGGVFDCQRFMDVLIYSLSFLSFALPQAMEVLAEAMWRPRLREEEVCARERGSTGIVVLLLMVMNTEYCTMKKGMSSLTTFPSLSPFPPHPPPFHHLLLTIDPSQLDIERQGIRFELEDLRNGPMVEPLLIEMIHMVSHMH